MDVDKEYLELAYMAEELNIKQILRGNYVIAECHCCGILGTSSVESLVTYGQNIYCRQCCRSLMADIGYHLGHNMTQEGFASHCTACWLPWYRANEVYCSALKPKPGKKYDTINRKWVKS